MTPDTKGNICMWIHTTSHWICFFYNDTIINDTIRSGAPVSKIEWMDEWVNEVTGWISDSISEQVIETENLEETTCFSILEDYFHTVIWMHGNYINIHTEMFIPHSLHRWVQVCGYDTEN